jgi:RimJ/RimL family protein N-acetyltransferase
MEKGVESLNLQIETTRLILRPFIKDDLPQFKLLLDNPGVSGWQMQLPRAAEFLDWQISQYKKADIEKGVICLGAFEKSSGNAVGAAGAGEHDDLHETEIFYNVHPNFQRQGYATEMAEAVTQWVMRDLDIPYLIGTADVDNIASQRVLEKCGFIYESTQELLVHVLGQTGKFKYYRYYKSANGEKHLCGS